MKIFMNNKPILFKKDEVLRILQAINHKGSVVLEFNKKMVLLDFDLKHYEIREWENHKLIYECYDIGELYCFVDHCWDKVGYKYWKQ